jgi:hypothetical protein
LEDQISITPSDHHLRKTGATGAKLFERLRETRGISPAKHKANPSRRYAAWWGAGQNKVRYFARKTYETLFRLTKREFSSWYKILQTSNELCGVWFTSSRMVRWPSMAASTFRSSGVRFISCRRSTAP